jgi:uroporphyrinogen-III decarboxylase
MMQNLTLRENFLRALRHEETEFVPFAYSRDAGMCGMTIPSEIGYPEKNIRDGFGVLWTSADSVANAYMPAPGDFILKDVTRWKKDITLPDIGKFDWEKIADEDYAMFQIDREKQVVGFNAYTGAWERLAALMGFEEAMVALIEEPEACNDLFTAITDYKIRLAEIAVKYFKADTFTNYDDIATERNLFLSPETYRLLIKPHHKRLNDAVKNLGMIPIQHTCGKADLCVKDYIETGAEAWDSAQPSNDIAGILDKYGDRFAIQGGWDTNGKPSGPGATKEEIKAEVERCFREYGGKKGFIFNGFIIAAIGDKTAEARSAYMYEVAEQLRGAPFSEKGTMLTNPWNQS